MCGKIQYTKKEAFYLLKRMPKLKNKQKKPVRAYQCPKCNYWHLTSIDEFGVEVNTVQNPEFKKYLSDEI